MWQLSNILCFFGDPTKEDDKGRACVLRVWRLCSLPSLPSRSSFKHWSRPPPSASVSWLWAGLPVLLALVKSPDKLALVVSPLTRHILARGHHLPVGNIYSVDDDVVTHVCAGTGHFLVFHSFHRHSSVTITHLPMQLGMKHTMNATNKQIIMTTVEVSRKTW